MFLSISLILETLFYRKTFLMAQSYSINTTQNVRLSFELASLGDRIAAGLIDLLVVLGYAFLVIYLLNEEILPDDMGYVYLYFTPALLYHLLLEVFNNGQSIGKSLMKTRVIRIDGTEPRVGDYVLRWLLGLFEILTSEGAIALVVFLFNGKGQRLGDMAAGTTVAKLKNRITLEETLFSQTDENYIPTYHNADLLNESEIETIKEVITAFSKRYSVETLTLISKTKFVVEQKLDVKSEVTDKEFLTQVVKDFNHLTGRLD